MLILTATQNTQPDYVALAMVLALAVVVVIMAIRRRLADNSKEELVTVEPVKPQIEAPGSAGQLKIYDVEPKTAAMLMAIVADKMGKPLNELRFISIREVK